MVRGSIGFGIVSLAAFSVWAFGGKWLQNHVGEGGMYAACALAFLALSWYLLHPLVRGSESPFRFYTIFVPAFIAYATVWCAAWFALRFGPGEWLGSLLGTAAFVGVLSWRFRNGGTFIRGHLDTTTNRVKEPPLPCPLLHGMEERESAKSWSVMPDAGFIRTSITVFVLHSAGYFLGGELMHWMLGAKGSALLNGLSKPGILVVAKLGWGALYGLGFGAGIGYAFHKAQEKSTASGRGPS